jgi:sugar lactone lactonase YvrE
MPTSYARFGFVLLLFACGGSDQPPEPVAELHWTFDSSMVFPADQSLHRAEDGVILPDGRLLVADQISGLRRINQDGTSEPFGDMVAAGYQHRPPDHSGGANGVSLEPDGEHVLVADVFGAGIYRVDVSTGATEKIYQHQYGINTAVRDSRLAIWFTQSTRNTPEAGDASLWSAVDVPRPDGALFRISNNGKPELMVDSLRFANGIAIDEANRWLYLAETNAGRVLRFRVDLDQGTLSERTVFADSVGADNVELDRAGNLWIASPLTNEVLVVNPRTGARQSVFRTLTPAQQTIVEEITRRGAQGTSRLALITPASWAPLPGMITGMIVGPGGPVYLTGLGNALLKLPR